jgi:hypothetical protein
MSAKINGIRVVKPQAIGLADTNYTTSNNGVGGYRMCILGTSQGGEPQKLMRFKSPIVAASVLKGGDLLTAANLAWNPSIDRRGASDIFAIRVNQATQSGTTIKASGTTDSLISVTSLDYGIWNNKIKINVTDATSKKFVCNSDDIPTLNVTEVSDNAAIGSYRLFYSQSDDKLVVKDSSGTTPIGTAVSANSSGIATVQVTDTSSGVTATIKVTYTYSVLAAQTGDCYIPFSIEPQGVNYKETYMTNTPSIKKNLGSLFSIRYTGSAASCVMTINTDTNDGTKTLVTLLGSGSTDSPLDIDLLDAQFDTIVELVNFINSNTNYIASISSNLADVNFPASEIDDITTQNIKDMDFIVTANSYALIEYVNANSVYVSMTIADGVTNTSLKPKTSASDMFLTGGSDGSSDTSAWVSALAVLASEDIDIIVPLTTDENILSMVVSQVNTFKDTTKVRRVYMGCKSYTSDSDIATTVRGLQSRNAMFIPQAIKVRDYKGTAKWLDACFAAAMVAGMVSGSQSLPRSTTYSYLNVLDVDIKDHDIDYLIDSGTCPIELETNVGFRLTIDRTTYLLDEKIENFKDSVSRIVNYIMKDSTKGLEKQFIGSSATPASVTAIRTYYESLLRIYESNGLITSGAHPDTGLAQPAFRNVKIYVINGICYVQAEVSPVDTIYYISNTVSFRPTTIIG